MQTQFPLSDVLDIKHLLMNMLQVHRYVTTLAWKPILIT